MVKLNMDTKLSRIFLVLALVLLLLVLIYFLDKRSTNNAVTAITISKDHAVVLEDLSVEYLEYPMCLSIIKGVLVNRGQESTGSVVECRKSVYPLSFETDNSVYTFESDKINSRESQDFSIKINRDCSIKVDYDCIVRPKQI